MKKYIISGLLLIVILATAAVANFTGYYSMDHNSETLTASSITAPVDANQQQTVETASKPSVILKTDCYATSECEPDCEPIPFEKCTPEQQEACLANSNCSPKHGFISYANAVSDNNRIPFEACTPEQKAACLSNLDNCDDMDKRCKPGVNCTPEEYKAWKELQKSL